MYTKRCNERDVALGFACRVRKNLEFILEERKKGEDVHEVTQIILSLLGLVVFPWESEHKAVMDKAQTMNLGDLEAKGWPHWKEGDDFCGNEETFPIGTLARLIRNLRNSVTHAHIQFSSDGRDASEVEVYFESYNPRKDKEKACWRASIRAGQLKLFCEKFVEFVLEP